MDDQRITDEGDLRKYRTEIPNIIDDLGLDPYQRALYTHYKRVCGANGGTCEEGVRRTAKKTQMSVGKVSEARSQLAKMGLIREHTQSPKEGQINAQIYVTIIDIWELNFAYFSYKDGRPDITGWPIVQLIEWVKRSYYERSGGERSPGERKCSGGERENKETRSPGEQKKEPTTQKEPTKNHDHQPTILLSATPQRQLLKDKITASVFEPQDRRGPIKFPTKDVADKFDATAARLNSNLGKAIDTALIQGCNSLIRVVNYIAKYQVNGGTHAAHSRNPDRPTQHQAGISQALNSKRRGSGG